MWIIESGTSRNMTRGHDNFSSISRTKTSHKVEHGDDNCYPMEGVGYSYTKLEPSGNVHLNNILSVPCLKKNLVSISCLEDKCDPKWIQIPSKSSKSCERSKLSHEEKPLKKVENTIRRQKHRENIEK